MAGIEMCPITSLDDNKRLAEMHLSQSSELLDKIVAYILDKDYMVQKTPLMLNKKLKFSNSIKEGKLRRQKSGFPEGMKIGKYNARDHYLIDSSLTELLRELKLEDQKKDIIKELFKHSDEELHLEKSNVLGSFLSRGLPDLRLPIEVYYKSTTLMNKIFLNANAPYSKEEDDKIMSLVKYNKDNSRTKYAGVQNLARELGRSYSSVSNRMTDLDEAYPAKRGEKERGEIREIMVVLMDSIGEGGHQKMLDYHFGPSHHVWESLSDKLKRPKKTIYQQFCRFIKPKLINYVNGFDEDQDTTLLLVQACVENNWDYTEQIDFGKLIKDKRFKGTTERQLKLCYSNTKGDAKKKYPEITDLKLTSEFILKRYLNERTHFRKKPRKIALQLVQDYEDLRSNST